MSCSLVLSLAVHAALSAAQPQACAPDNVAAWLGAGQELLRNCQSGDPNAARAAVFALQGPCSCGDTNACVALAVAWQWCPRCGVSRAEDTAMALYQTACGQGHGVACLNLGMGREHAAQLVQARTAYDAACTAGEMQGCGLLGAMLLSNAADVGRAVALLNRACDAADLSACRTLAQAYALETPGVTRVAEGATTARKRACLAGAMNLCDRASSAAAADE